MSTHCIQLCPVYINLEQSSFIFPLTVDKVYMSIYFCVCHLTCSSIPLMSYKLEIKCMALLHSN